MIFRRIWDELEPYYRQLGEHPPDVLNEMLQRRGVTSIDLRNNKKDFCGGCVIQLQESDRKIIGSKKLSYSVAHTRIITIPIIGGEQVGEVSFKFETSPTYLTALQSRNHMRQIAPYFVDQGLYVQIEGVGFSRNRQTLD